MVVRENAEEHQVDNAMNTVEETGPRTDLIELPRVLILCFSFSGQTVGLINNLVNGLKDQGVDPVVEKLRPVEPLHFPASGYFSTFGMMLATFFRRRIAIEELSSVCSAEYDLIILAGPTWSYNPSGPILSLLDRDGPHLFGGKVVLPLISCRGYWRTHWFGLRSLLRRCGAIVPNLIVFSHPCPEPWRTIGVFLKIAGKNPERSRFFGRYYKRFGHSREQWDEAWRFGMQIGEALKRNVSLESLDLKTVKSLP